MNILLTDKNVPHCAYIIHFSKIAKEKLAFLTDAVYLVWTCENFQKVSGLDRLGHMTHMPINSATVYINNKTLYLCDSNNMR